MPDKCVPGVALQPPTQQGSVVYRHPVDADTYAKKSGSATNVVRQNTSKQRDREGRGVQVASVVTRVKLLGDDLTKPNNHSCSHHVVYTQCSECEIDHVSGIEAGEQRDTAPPATCAHV